MNHSLYVFDMDETLIHGDTVTTWHHFLVDEGIAPAEFLEQEVYFTQLYHAGELQIADYIRYSLSPLKQMSRHDVDALVTRCVSERIMPLVFPEATQLLGVLKSQQATIVMISATVSFIVKQVADQLGIEHAIGVDTTMAPDPQTAPGYQMPIVGVESFREGKVTRLEQWLTSQPETYHTIHFYSDSINDLPLCEYADHTYLINPCPKLRAYLPQHREWQVYRWGQSNG